MGRRWGRQDWSQEDELRSHRFNLGYEEVGNDMGGRRKKNRFERSLRGRIDIVTN